MIYLPLIFLFLRTLYNRFVLHDFFRFYLVALCFLVLGISPFIISVTGLVGLTFSNPESIATYIKQPYCIFCIYISALSFLLLVNYSLPQLWFLRPLTNYRSRLICDRNFILPFSIKTRTYCWILFAILLIKLGSSYSTISTLSFINNRDLVSSIAEEQSLRYGRGLVGFLSNFSFVFSSLFYCDYCHRYALKGPSKSSFSLIGTLPVNLYTAINLSDYLENLFTTSSRSGMIVDALILLIPIIYFNYCKMGFFLPSLGKIRFLLISLFISTFPIFYSVAAFIRGGQLPDLSKINFVHGFSGMMTISEFANLHLLLHSNQLSYENGVSFVYNFFSFIPRLIWSDKPVTSFSYRVSDLLYGLTPGDLSTWVHTYTPWGEGYMQFGLFGIPAASVLVLFSISIAVRFLNSFKITSVLFLTRYNMTLLACFRADVSSFWGRLYEYIFFSLLCLLILRFTANYLSPKDITQEVL